MHVQSGKCSGGLAGAFQAIQENPEQLVEPSPEFFLEGASNELAVVEVETEIGAGPHGGLLHSKIELHQLSAHPAMLNLYEAMAANKALDDKAAKERAEATVALQTALTAVEAGARLNLDTPEDGHCLLWALLQGGLTLPADMGDLTLSVTELRSLALNMAGLEDLEAAALTTPGEDGMPLTVEQYVDGMRRGLWGDMLMIGCLARCFRKDITVVTASSVRTFAAEGGDMDGPLHDAIWIGHRVEDHYYGILRAAAPTPQSQQLQVVKPGEQSAASCDVKECQALGAAVRSGNVDPLGAVNFLTDEQVL